jgi:hypothetical protein
MKRLALLLMIICMVFYFPLVETEAARSTRESLIVRVLRRRIVGLRKLVAVRNNDVAFRDRIITDLRNESAGIKQTTSTQSPVTSQSQAATTQTSSTMQSPAFAKQETVSYIPAGRTVTVFNVQGGVDPATKYYQLTGTVQNTGSTPVYGIRLITNYYDASNQVVSNTITPSTTTLQPTQSISFSDSLADATLSPKIMRHDIQVLWRDTP